ncbi:alpha/beta hydrolase [Massilia sp. Leaf139]|uniref:RBBP9/YdeN family alpha/beta hydrolase n=1 Tax=Massilia sp. Leaf139 TaxID=1736272 RepID=UPI0006F48206|nr:alpha/beta hydrolase [Massilia sp. Leaf139]KQQ96832.1 alpha/beta hydrolase [Massilia sp. Leaf139]
MDGDVLILSGLWDSGPQHWQSHWEARHPEWRRVDHRDFNDPVKDEWVAELDAAIAACTGAPVLVAHSLGCMLAAHWAASGSPLRAAGAFLVAPSDVDAPSYPIDPKGFAPVPFAPLPFPSLVVASTNDAFVSRERAQAFAAAWGSRYVEIGDAGHVNADAGYGDWPEGERLLLEFLAQLRK